MISIAIGLAFASPYVVLLWARRRSKQEYRRWLPLLYGGYAVVSAAVFAGVRRTPAAYAGLAVVFFVVSFLLYRRREQPHLLILWLVVVALMSFIFILVRHLSG